MDKTCNKIVYVGYAFGHHKGTHGGYHHIREHVKYDYVIDCQHYQDKLENAHNKKSIFSKVFHRINGLIFGTAIFPSFLFHCLWLSLKHHHQLTFHFIYSEGLYLPLAPLFLAKSKVVCTVHLPVERIRRSKLIKRLSNVNQIILVGEKDIEDIKSLTNNNNVVFIPHGVDTQFYSPQESKAKEPYILTVGNMLRDYHLANEVFIILSKKYPNLKYVIVAHTVNKEIFSGNKNVKILKGISDTELRNLYRGCECFYLPVKKYTANNALLEAASVGCNILISSDHIDESYIPYQYIKTCPLTVDDSVLHLSQILDKQIRSNDFRLYVQNNLDWSVIGKKTEKLLRNI